MVTREEFARRWAERRGVAVQDLEALGHQIIDCECGDDVCLGYRMVTRAPEARPAEPCQRCGAVGTDGRTSRGVRFCADCRDGKTETMKP